MWELLRDFCFLIYYHDDHLNFCDKELPLFRCNGLLFLSLLLSSQVSAVLKYTYLEVGSPLSDDNPGTLFFIFRLHRQVDIISAVSKFFRIISPVKLVQTPLGSEWIWFTPSQRGWIYSSTHKLWINKWQQRTYNFGALKLKQIRGLLYNNQQQIRGSNWQNLGYA